MPLTKPCEFCGTEFPKPPTCGLPEWAGRRFCSSACKKASQRGKPAWNKGLHQESKATRIPCRICGGPTKYAGIETNRYYGLVHCEKAACALASRAIKNERISARASEMYAAGARPRVRHAWSTVKRISDEETLLMPWFLDMGWQSQYRVLTDVHTNKLPRLFHLDFALPERKLYVEIDGHVHRLRHERDARRDAMLTERGWTGLRLPAKDVQASTEIVKQTITSWLCQLTAAEK